MVLVSIFAVNALLFVPLGQRMGVLFNTLPSLSAYGWDLAGSLCGTLCFGLFSLRLFSPVLGMAGVMLVYLAICGRAGGCCRSRVCGRPARHRMGARPEGDLVPVLLHQGHRIDHPEVSQSAPPPDLRHDARPPDLQRAGEPVRLPPRRRHGPAVYTPGIEARDTSPRFWLQYHLPYTLCSGRDRVLIVGAGGGCDVEAALASGVRHVDAVEIDPAIVDISRRFNAGAPYSDPRVSVHIDDARSYLARAAPGYDLVVFGFLDSQALFSSMNNVRLDGYVYTVESIRSAYRLLNDHGMLGLSFSLGAAWLGPKLYGLVAEATGRTPAMYMDASRQLVILCVPRDPARLPADR